MIEELLLLAIVGIVVIAAATALAPKVRIAGPLILVIVGLVVSLLPFVPAIEVDPELIIIGVLPPLLYSAAVNLPAIEFRRDFGPIAGLAVVLVAISAVALAFFFQAVLPSLDFMLALALGAILSPTDAVATSIAKRLGLSSRVVTLLEGESLLNDATSLVLLRTAVAASAVSASGTVSRPGFVGAFVWGVVAALIVGGLVGWINLRVRAHIPNAAANTALGLVVPFAVYLPTEHLGGSGLVAAVVAGIVTGQGAARWYTPELRMSDRVNWRTVELVLEGAVFLIMGLELKEIVRENGASEAGIWHGVWLAAAALGIVLAVRAVYASFIVWLQSRRARTRRQRADELTRRLDEVSAEAPGDAHPHGLRTPEHLERRTGILRRRLRGVLADIDYYNASPLGWKHGTVIVWAGMRGVVTLAAAQTLPTDAPERALLVFVAFLVAVGSLMLQGFTLPALVKLLRIEPEDESVDREQIRRLDDELRVAAHEALSGDLRRRDGSEYPPELVEKVVSRVKLPLAADQRALTRDALELRIIMVEAMRARLIELSSGGEFSSENLRHALAELDAQELSLELRLRGEDE